MHYLIFYNNLLNKDIIIKYIKHKINKLNENMQVIETMFYDLPNTIFCILNNKLDLPTHINNNIENKIVLKIKYDKRVIKLCHKYEICVLKFDYLTEIIPDKINNEIH